jgi:hypothetical protein
MQQTNARLARLRWDLGKRLANYTRNAIRDSFLDLLRNNRAEVERVNAAALFLILANQHGTTNPAIGRGTVLIVQLPVRS